MLIYIYILIYSYIFVNYFKLMTQNKLIIIVFNWYVDIILCM